MHHIALINVCMLDPLAKCGEISFAEAQNCQSRPLQLLRSRLTTKWYRASTVAIQYLSDLLLGGRKMLGNLLDYGRCQPCRLWLSRRGIESILRSLKLLLRLTQLAGDEMHSLSALLRDALLLFNRRPKTCLCFPNLRSFGSIAKLIWDLKHSDWSWSLTGIVLNFCGLSNHI